MPPDTEHPYGHTRSEAAAGSNVALLLILSALTLVWHSLRTMGHPSPPPETFTFGGAVAHVVTWDSYRRQVLIGALAERGADVSGLGDPIHWDG